ncbi:hypothetical protein SAMN05216464_10671 [Mucilaginibacter pineti]|uniref:Uncharacterized protein n=1 Tax=Mucilaginibacter pineti TaxID=1391627 RepID=A0A1G7CRM8_9SPHI|nr:hypothetical protein [Mucilaginibacter pineti]SDE42002.1 hypothetical protein SAMN05216464_10671 [Mucilaginibacter pineti]
MKTYKTPSASKLVARFDNELKNMLLQDLRSFKANSTVRNISQQAARENMSAA